LFCQYFPLHWKNGENEYVIAVLLTFYDILHHLHSFPPLSMVSFFTPVSSLFPKKGELIFGRENYSFISCLCDICFTLSNIFSLKQDLRFNNECRTFLMSIITNQYKDYHFLSCLRDICYTLSAIFSLKQDLRFYDECRSFLMSYHL